VKGVGKGVVVFKIKTSGPSDPIVSFDKREPLPLFFLMSLVSDI